jgi:hypothetical protein
MASALCPSGHYEVDNSTFDLWRLRSRNKSGTKVFCLWVLVVATRRFLSTFLRLETKRHNVNDFVDYAICVIKIAPWAR